MWTPQTTYQSNTVHIRRYDWMSRDGKSPLDPKFGECIVKLCEPFEHKSTYSKPMHFSIEFLRQLVNMILNQMIEMLYIFLVI